MAALTQAVDVKRVRCQYIFVGHKATVTAVIVANGWLYSASADKTIRMWCLTDLKCKDILKGHNGPINCLAFSNFEGGFLYSGSDDCTIKVWKVGRAKSSLCVETKREHKKPVTSLRVCGVYLASGSEDGSICLWSIEPNGRLQALEKIPEAHEGAIRCMTSWKSMLFSGAEDGRVKVWNLSDIEAGGDVQTIKFITLLSEFDSPVRALCIKNGVLISAGMAVRTMDLTRAKKWKDLEAIRPSKQLDDDSGEPVTALHPGFVAGDAFISAAAGQIKVWSEGKSRVIKKMNDHKDKVTCFAETKIYFNPILLAGSYLFSASADKTVKCYLLGDKELNFKWCSAAEKETLHTWAAPELGT